jgi:cytochrome c oxidase assembly protein subunit 15
MPLVAVIAQVALGVFAVVNAIHIQPGKFGTFELIAEAHQLVAMFLLLSLVTNLYLVKRR